MECTDCDKRFEPEEKVGITGQTEHLQAQRPIWLRQSVIIRTEKYLRDVWLNSPTASWEQALAYA